MFSAICYVKQCENMGLIHGDKYSLCVCITVLVDGQKVRNICFWNVIF